MKRLSIILIILILVLSIPINSFAINSEQEFFNYLDSIGTRKANSSNKIASYDTYRNYNLIVYGSPWGDTQISEISGPQKRYLGYTINDEFYTNPKFPDDSNTGNPYEGFNYIKPNGALKSWENIKDTSQRDHMLNSILVGNRVTTSTFTLNSIGGMEYGKLLSASTWKSQGNIYLQHMDSKVWYITLTVPPMVGDTIVTGDISTPSDTYYIRKDETQVLIQTTVTARAILSGSARIDHVEEVKATSIGVSETAKGKANVSKTTDFVATRTNYKPGTHTVELKGSVSLRSIFNDNDSSGVSKTITLIVEAEGDEPYVTTTVTPEPKEKKFEGQDIDVTLTVKGDLHNYTKTSNIKEWVFYARQKEDTKALEKKIYTKTLNASTNYKFKIPASKVNKDNFTQSYVVRARVYFNEKVNGKDYYDAPAETQTYIYKNIFTPPTQPSDPVPTNIPPTARISGLNKVIIGETAYFRDVSWDSDGEIVERIWTHDIPGADEITDIGGNITFNELGMYNIGLYVIDDMGDGDSTEHKVEVLPPPPPVAKLNFEGVLKENRIIKMLNESSSHSRFPIIQDKTQITIEPIDHGATSNIIYSGTLTDSLFKDLTFKNSGTYKFMIYVENTAGLSDTKEYIKYIQPDVPPIADFSMIQKIYRDPYYDNYAKMEITDFSFSPDGDPITERIWSIRYNSTNNKNSDGTNNFSDDPILNIKDTQLIMFTEKTFNHNGVTYKLTKTARDKLDIKVNQIGAYLLDLEVIEGFGQDFVPEHINPSDYQKGNTSDKHHFEKTITVFNREPFVDFN